MIFKVYVLKLYLSMCDIADLRQNVTHTGITCKIIFQQKVPSSDWSGALTCVYALLTEQKWVGGKLIKKLEEIH